MGGGVGFVTAVTTDACSDGREGGFGGRASAAFGASRFEDPLGAPGSGFLSQVQRAARDGLSGTEAGGPSLGGGSAEAGAGAPLGGGGAGSRLSVRLNRDCKAIKFQYLHLHCCLMFGGQTVSCLSPIRFTLRASYCAPQGGLFEGIERLNTAKLADALRRGVQPVRIPSRLRRRTRGTVRNLLCICKGRPWV